MVLTLTLVTTASCGARPDREGFVAFGAGRHADAAEAFADPMWKGVALFRAGEFEEAAGYFAGLTTPEASYNRGNALVMLGKYGPAIEAYDAALTAQADLEDAEANREVARIRMERVKKEGGEMTGGKLEADEIVINTDPKKSGGEETTTEGGETTAEETRAMWLRSVRTKPSDFLRAKFVFQNARKEKK